MIMRPEIKAKIEGFMNALGVPDVTKEREPEEQVFMSMQGACGVRESPCSIMLLLHKCHCPHASEGAKFKTKSIAPTGETFLGVFETVVNMYPNCFVSIWQYSFDKNSECFDCNVAH